jgi:hypothetical protein
MRQTDIPPGWSSNPAAWRKRIPAACLAQAGLAIATCLALFQYGVFASIWDPFFGNGSRTVLTSSVSNTVVQYTGIPIKDAALGALAYLIELIADLVGGSQRWRTSPWAVAIFAGIAGLRGGGSGAPPGVRRPGLVHAVPGLRRHFPHAVWVSTVRSMGDDRAS